MNYVEHFNLFGIEAAQIPCIKGDGAPTTSTEGAVGCLYMDMSSENKDLYKCTSIIEGVYTWEVIERGGGVAPMIVCEHPDDTEVADHAYDEIASHALSGGLVYLYIDGKYQLLSRLDPINKIAFFEDISVDPDLIFQYQIDDIPYIYRKFIRIATKDDIGDISTALDGIIAIQNELIGGDSA